MDYFEHEDIDALMGVCPDDPDESDVDARRPRKGAVESESAARAPKVSQIPHDYDPTPSYHELPDGHNRPTKTCFVAPNVVQEYDLGTEIHLLSADALEGMGTRDRKFRFLATKCVSVAGVLYVKERNSGIWRPHTRKDAEAQLLNDWSDRTLYNIVRTTVRDFLLDARYAVVHQTVYVPGAGDFVVFQDKRCLNIGQQPPASFDPLHRDSPAFALLMEVIVRNLLDEEFTSVTDTLTAIASAKPSVLKWVFHWWASVYQRPGLHIGTNLWFVGSQQGVGKGVFSDALLWLVGPGNGLKVHAKELGGEWNDFIEGNVLLVGDEITMASKKGFNDMLKSFIANDVIALRKRNIGQYNIPNVTNWMFTTNNPKPITIDVDDRRNTFVATRESIEARDLGRRFGELPDDQKLEAYHGLAALLSGVQIDDRLIRHAIDTPLKEQLKELGARPVRLWYQESSFVLAQWQVGAFCSTDELYGDFSIWASTNGFHASVTSRSAFSTDMAELARKGYVSSQERMRLRDGRRPRGFRKLRDMEILGTIEDAPDVGEPEHVPNQDTNERAERTRALVVSIRERLAARQ